MCPTLERISDNINRLDKEIESLKKRASALESDLRREQAKSVMLKLEASHFLQIFEQNDAELIHLNRFLENSLRTRCKYLG